MSRYRKQRPAFEEGEIAECNVDFYSSAPKGTQFRVAGTHSHLGELVVDVWHPNYGSRPTSYYAKNFINLSRKLPLFQPEKKMSNYVDPNKPCIAFEVTGQGEADWAIIERSASQGKFLSAMNYPEIQRDIGNQPGKRWIIVQVVATAEPERPKPPYVFKPV